MATEWVKNQTEPDDPKILRLAELTGHTPDAVFTAIVGRWWFWVDRNCKDEATGLTLASVDAVLRLPQKRGKASLAAAMMDPDVDWIALDGQRAIVQRYDEHFSASAKRRAADQKRKSRGRLSANGPDENGQPPVPEKGSGSGSPASQPGESEGGEPPDGKLVDLLMGDPWRINARRAKALCSQHPAEVIRHAVRMAKQRKDAGGGLVVRLLTDGDAAEDLATYRDSAMRKQAIALFKQQTPARQRELAEGFGTLIRNPLDDPHFVEHLANLLREAEAARARMNGATA